VWRVAAVLGIDLGTSQVKAVVVGAGGEMLGRGRAGYPVNAPAEGHAETDPDDWWRATVSAVREALAAAAAGGTRSGQGGDAAAGGDAGASGGLEVVGVGVDGQMHGVALADKDGRPVRPAILWLDQRAAAEAAWYERLPAELTAPLGNQASAGMAGPILCWLAAHEPDAMRRARWALQPKDWLRLRLTGRAATDPTDASGTLLFDLPRGAWAEDLITALGLPADKLPPVLASAAIAGRLLPGPASELGLATGIPVATGAADTAAALYAAVPDTGSGPAAAGNAPSVGPGPEPGRPGAAVPDTADPGTGLGAESGRLGLAGGEWALLTVGTGGQWVVPEGRFRPVLNTNLFRAVGGGFYRLAAAQNVGAALGWVRGVFGASWQELYDTAARPWQAGTPVFVPYLAQERWDRAATGTWTGLTLAHTKDDLLRGALEGVAFLLRRRLEDLRAAGHHPEAAIIGGGGASHPAWRQLLADVLGLPLHPADTSWLSAAGAARVAAAAAGMGGTGDGWVRSGYEKPAAVVPGERNAASSGYDRFTHQLSAP
jgi:xylulokinase